MPETSSKSKLLVLSLLLLGFCFAAGMVTALFNLNSLGILARFRFFWIITNGLLLVASWTPAVLLVAATSSTELAERGSTFLGNATKALLPAMILAGSVSIFYLLLVPQIQARQSLYQESSRMFHEAIKASDLAIKEGRLEDASRQLLTSRAIDINSEAHQNANTRLQEALVRQAQDIQRAELERVRDSNGPETRDMNENQDFFLQARTALAEKRYFEAYYLARQAVALYPNRQEVRNFVAETWHQLQSAKPSAERVAETTLYAQKVAGYKLLLDGDYLDAYRLFFQLQAEHPQDPDIQNYLLRSRNQLLSLYFFIDEFEQAYNRHRPLPFQLTLKTGDTTYQLVAESAIATMEGIYFQNLEYRTSGSHESLMFSPYARLTGNSLLPRAVNRHMPTETSEETWYSGQQEDKYHLAILPFGEPEVRMALVLADKTSDIPLHVLVRAMREAAELGKDPVPLRREFAARLAYPFATVMLVLLGTALGMRFRGETVPGVLSIILGAPILVVLAAAPIRIIKEVGLLLAEFTARFTGNTGFIASWLGILAFITASCLFLAARIASHSKY